jgi:hypothetical protein|tara:strand:- start:934 stop:1284 length:351 start_codon:yes stop_codon:yes gene_type:complete
MKYKIFQIKLTDAEVDMVNDKGHDSVPKNSMRLDMNLRANDTGKIAAKAFKLGYYTHVSNITADSLEGVFHVGNMGPESSIERISPMHSLSVGDIVEDEAGKMSVVADWGFKDVII